MGEPYIAQLRRRAIKIIAAGTILYGLGVGAGPLVAAWTGLPLWYRSLLSLQEPERNQNACAFIRLPMDSDCRSTLDVPGHQLVRVYGGAMAEVHVAYWHRTRDTIADECARSLRRQCQLVSLLDDTKVPESRKLLDEERARFAQLVAQERSTRLGGYDIAARIVLGSLDVVFACLAVWLLVRSARTGVPGARTQMRDGVVRRWKGLFAVFTTLGIATIFLTVGGGINVDDKLWIGADSWVISRPLWFCNIGSMIGVVIVFAAPMTLLWQLGHAAFRPGRLELDNPDGTCGVGAYVSFLHTWTILTFAFAIGPAILWIRFLRVDVSSHPGYLAPVGAALVLTGLLVGRLVNNAIRLRAEYHEAIAYSARTWDPDEAKKQPPDPTISFIGENWWKLPATLGAIVLALWQILEWTGAAHAIAAAAGN